MSSRTKGDPGLLPIFQDFLLTEGGLEGGKGREDLSMGRGGRGEREDLSMGRGGVREGEGGECRERGLEGGEGRVEGQ